MTIAGANELRYVAVAARRRLCQRVTLSPKYFICELFFFTPGCCCRQHEAARAGGRAQPPSTTSVSKTIRSALAPRATRAACARRVAGCRKVQTNIHGVDIKTALKPHLETK